MSSNLVSSLTGAVHGRLVFNRRTQVLARHLSAALPQGAAVLDVGCGDGTIDALIQEQRPDLQIHGVDVMLRPVTRIPVSLFDGRVLPFPDKSFDSVMFVDVLHHTDDPVVLLREAARVARGSIVLKDHTMEGPLAYARLRLMDWVGNAHHNVVLPYNYWPEQRWRDAFATLGLRVETWQQRLGLYPFPVSLVFEARLHFVSRLSIG